jgi:hypothetical protein
MSPLFAATAEATEEAIYNAIFKATTVTSARGTREAVPLKRLLSILEKYGALHWDRKLPRARPLPANRRQSPRHTYRKIKTKDSRTKIPNPCSMK